LAPNGCSVLVHGETGTGKDVVAQLLHELSGRPGPLVRVNCAAIPAELVESELFGHEAGSFTGASMQRKGALELAAGGTLLLDEIADLPLHQQAKLLCALETPFRRVGGQEPIRFAGRVVSATHRDLLADVRSGRFREDLFYRVAGVPVEMPPLRAHPEDIAELAAWILDSVAFGLPLSMAALRALERHPWPGNVRELQHVLEAAAALDEDGTVGVGDLVALRHAPSHGDAHVGAAILELEGPGSKFLRAQRAAAGSAVQRTGGNVSEAARLLGIDRKTLTRLLPAPIQRKREPDR
jgi:DNA-binding NtrC family response regulator